LKKKLEKDVPLRLLNGYGVKERCMGMVGPGLPTIMVVIFQMGCD